MAALLHQAALQPPHSTPKPWTLASTSSLSLPHAAPSKRLRAPTRQLQAASNGGAVGTPATDSTSSSSPTPAKAPSSKKTSRKEKQRQQQRLREREEQQQLLLRASLVEAAGGEERGGGDDELPQAVFDRILRRILFTVGVPMASGVALLNVYDALKRGRGVVVPPWVPLLTILIAFGTSALGIAYGTLSASWDPGTRRRKGRCSGSTRPGPTGPSSGRKRSRRIRINNCTWLLQTETLSVCKRVTQIFSVNTRFSIANGRACY